MNCQVHLAGLAKCGMSQIYQIYHLHRHKQLLGTTHLCPNFTQTVLYADVKKDVFAFVSKFKRSKRIGFKFGVLANTDHRTDIFH